MPYGFWTAACVGISLILLSSIREASAGLTASALGMLVIESASLAILWPRVFALVSPVVDHPCDETLAALREGIQSLQPIVVFVCFISACAIGLWLGLNRGFEPIGPLLFLGYRWVLVRLANVRVATSYWLLLAVTVWACMASGAVASIMLKG